MLIFCVLLSMAHMAVPRQLQTTKIDNIEKHTTEAQYYTENIKKNQKLQKNTTVELEIVLLNFGNEVSNEIS